jgi:hypothetical protein
VFAAEGIVLAITAVLFLLWLRRGYRSWEIRYRARGVLGRLGGRSWLPVGFVHPASVEVMDGYHLRPIRAADLDLDYPAVAQPPGRCLTSGHFRRASPPPTGACRSSTAAWPARR